MVALSEVHAPQHRPLECIDGAHFSLSDPHLPPVGCDGLFCMDASELGLSCRLFHLLCLLLVSLYGCSTRTESVGSTGRLFVLLWLFHFLGVLLPRVLEERQGKRQ